MHENSRLSHALGGKSMTVATMPNGKKKTRKTNSEDEAYNPNSDESDSDMDESDPDEYDKLIPKTTGANTRKRNVAGDAKVSSGPSGSASQGPYSSINMQNDKSDKEVRRPYGSSNSAKLQSKLTVKGGTSSSKVSRKVDPKPFEEMNMDNEESSEENSDYANDEDSDYIDDEDFDDEDMELNDFEFDQEDMDSDDELDDEDLEIAEVIGKRPNNKKKADSKWISKASGSDVYGKSSSSLDTSSIRKGTQLSRENQATSLLKPVSSSSSKKFAKSTPLFADENAKSVIASKKKKYNNADNSMSSSSLNQQTASVTKPIPSIKKRNPSRSSSIQTVPVEVPVPKETAYNSKQSSSSSNSQSFFGSWLNFFRTGTNQPSNEQTVVRKSTAKKVTRPVSSTSARDTVAMSPPATFKLPKKPSSSSLSARKYTPIFYKVNPFFKEDAFYVAARNLLYVEELHQRRNDLRRTSPKIKDDEILETPEVNSYTLNNGFTYVLDEKSRVVRVSGTVNKRRSGFEAGFRNFFASEVKVDRVRQGRRDLVQALGHNNKYVAGHIIGHQFCLLQNFDKDTCDDPLNLVPMHEKLNVGAYKKLEMLLSRNTEKFAVFVDVFLRYDDSKNGLGSHVPASLTFEQYQIGTSGKRTLLKSAMVKNANPYEEFHENTIYYSGPTKVVNP